MKIIICFSENFAEILVLSIFRSGERLLVEVNKHSVFIVKILILKPLLSIIAGKESLLFIYLFFFLIECWANKFPNVAIFLGYNQKNKSTLYWFNEPSFYGFLNSVWAIFCYLPKFIECWVSWFPDGPMFLGYNQIK